MKRALFWICGTTVCVAIGAFALHSRGRVEGLSSDVLADRIVINKAARTLVLYRKQQRLKSYKIVLGRRPVGHKLKEGDARTPEGVYSIDSRNPRSAYHKSLHISYPNAQDRESARRRKVAPGGDIFIHGQPNGSESVLRGDWTLGCVAVTNDEIDEIWRSVPNGTPVVILP